jgi:membrane protease YdiL (CAAX protease family)
MTASTGERAIGDVRGWIGFVVGFGLIWATLQITSSPQPTPLRSAVACVATAICAVVVVMVLWRVPARGAPIAVGLGMPTAVGLGVAAGVTLVCALGYLLFPTVTGLVLRARDGWPGLLLGVFLFNGVAEELAWRGYVFRALRQGRPFWLAVLLAMPLLALTHVPIVLSSGWVVGLAAMVVAAVTTLPLAYLYELGGRTVWAPALVHAAIDAFRALTVDPAATMVFSLYVSAVALVVPLLAIPIGWAVLRFIPRSRPG